MNTTNQAITDEMETIINSITTNTENMESILNHCVNTLYNMHTQKVASNDGSTPISDQVVDIEYSISEYSKVLKSTLTLMWRMKTHIPKYNQMLMSMPTFDNIESRMKHNNIHSDVLLVVPRLDNLQAAVNKFYDDLQNEPLINRATNIMVTMGGIIQDHITMHEILVKTKIDRSKMVSVFNEISKLWQQEIDRRNVNSGFKHGIIK